MSRTANGFYTRVGQTFDIVIGDERFNRNDIQYLQAAVAYHVHDGVDAGLPVQEKLSLTVTYSGGRVSQTLHKNGATTVKQEDLTYNADGTVATVVDTTNGIVVTSTFSYNADGTVSGVARA